MSARVLKNKFNKLALTCSKHKDKKIIYYCFTHEEFLCNMCICDNWKDDRKSKEYEEFQEF